QRVVRDELDRVESEELERLVEEPEERREHLLLPDQRRDDWHHQERRDQQRAYEALAEELAVEQQRERGAEDQGEQNREDGHLDARPHRIAEERVAQQR